MPANACSKVCQLAFDATQFSDGRATTFGSSSRGSTLLCERLALSLRFSSEISQ
jgi:hypothetical protein